MTENPPSTDGGQPTSSDSTEQKEQHRIGTVDRWDAPDSGWAAEYDWTRYRGPDPWPVPGGWVFKDPEGGGWWEYFGDDGVGHGRDDSILDELKESVEDPYDAMDELREQHGTYAHLTIETANPDEVTLRNLEDEELEWTFMVAGTAVFRRVEPDRSDAMSVIAQALHAYHTGDLAEGDVILPSSGRKPDDILEQEKLEKRQEENESLDRFAGADMEDDRESKDDTEYCINCGTEIEGEPVNGSGDVKKDGIDRLVDGEKISIDALFGFDDGPYCSLDCSVDTEAGPDE